MLQSLWHPDLDRDVWHGLLQSQGRGQTSCSTGHGCDSHMQDMQ